MRYSAAMFCFTTPMMLFLRWIFFIYDVPVLPFQVIFINIFFKYFKVLRSVQQMSDLGTKWFIATTLRPLQDELPSPASEVMFLLEI